MFRIPIIDRYVTREIFFVFSGIVAVFILVLMGGSLVRLLQMVAGGDIGKDAIFTLLGLETLRMLGRLMPPAFFFAALIVLGRMYRDNEITVLESSGIGVSRLFRLVLMLAVPMTLISLWLTLFIYPSTTYLTMRIKLEQQDAVLVASMDAGRFVESDNGQFVLYTESRGDGPGSLNRVFAQHRLKYKLGIVTAMQASHYKDEATMQRVLKLEDGVRYERSWGEERSHTLLDFGEFEMRINPSSTERLHERYKTRATADLLNDAHLGAQAELQSRITHPLSLLAFALLAVPLSRALPRQTVQGRIVIAIFVYVLFTGLNEVAATWMVKEVTPAGLGTWWVIGLIFAAAFVLIMRDLKPGMRRPRAVAT